MKKPWIEHQKIIVLILFVFPFGLFVSMVLYAPSWPIWTGFSGKTTWDWLQLFIVPAVLTFSVLWFNQVREKSNREIEDNRLQEEALQKYLDRMTELLLEKGLRESTEQDEVRSIARTRTLTVLRELDGRRKGLLLRFLFESRLLLKDKTILDLRGADFSGADLSGADLNKIFLRGVNLSDANLSNSYLYGGDLSDSNLRKVNLYEADVHDANMGVVDLSGADLRWARLDGAILNNAKLLGSNLHSADLGGADLSLAKMQGADLSNASLTGAILTIVDLSAANLYRADLSRAKLLGTILLKAKITKDQLADAAQVVGVTLPDGSKK